MKTNTIIATGPGYFIVQHRGKVIGTINELPGGGWRFRPFAEDLTGNAAPLCEALTQAVHYDADEPR